MTHYTTHRFFYALLFVALIGFFTSCSKDHDLISEYQVATELQVIPDGKLLDTIKLSDTE